MLPRKALFRQLSSIKRATGAPLISMENATIYPLGETITPFFSDLTWRINEGETWAVVGASSSGRRVLFEVESPESN
jgi:ABC-type molybdenum transport system ATPase subunit/photorepair protein PhrA